MREIVVLALVIGWFTYELLSVAFESFTPLLGV